LQIQTNRTLPNIPKVGPTGKFMGSSILLIGYSVYGLTHVKVTSLVGSPVPAWISVCTTKGQVIVQLCDVVDSPLHMSYLPERRWYGVTP
jgi:hypothetical protein